ncbi:hypothetical protein U5801_11740 [Lamprobacter modestohalophilus]|uniref:hypothetical protein n=1 Tax=Lamprobacter modestohalophilus TaxID=1064514 RepID=UPI002ADED33E|nr:hypothetical protein [Lamprobacter modestohalophilus]MEA1050476.1 hypothetical protein [Lamprobacter modestohalophilus]
MFREPQTTDSAGSASSEPLTPGHLLTLVYSERPIGKVFRRNLLDGSVEKQVQSELSEGRLKCSAVWSLAELERLINRLGPQHALIYGVPLRAATVGTSVPVVSIERASGRPEAVTRTADQFAWPERGVLMLDIDPPKDDGPFPIAREVIDAVRALHPIFAEADALWCPSASSGVDGAGVKGQRLYFLIKDARLIEDARQVIKDLQWVKGHGRYELAKPGTLIERWLIDAVTWKPEWLDFAGEPTLEDGIQRERIPAFIDRAISPAIDLSSLLALDTEALHQAAEELRQAAGAALHQAAIEQRARYLEQHPERTAYLGADPYKDRGVLAAEHVLYTQDGQAVTVRELLADRERWHGTAFCDPIEPDYRGGQPVAKAFLLGGAQTVSSFAHGQKNYRLLPDLSELFAGPEGAEQESAPQEPSAEDQLANDEHDQGLHRVVLAARERRQQAVAEADAAEAQARAASIGDFPTASAAIEAGATLIDGPVGAGKTTHGVEKLSQALLLPPTEPTFLYSVATLAAMDDIARSVTDAVGVDRAGRLGLMRHDRKLPPLHDDVPYTFGALLTTHGAIRHRGDDLSADGRLVRKLAAMRKREEDKGLPAHPHVPYLDEIDALMASLLRLLLLDYRTRTTLDVNTDETATTVAMRCGHSCKGCIGHHNTTNAATLRPKGVEQYRLDPRVQWRNSAIRIDLPDWTKTMCKTPIQHGVYSIAPIAPSEVPALEPFRLVDDPETGQQVFRPAPAGIIATLARAPGASVRWCHPLNVNGDPLPPGQDGNPEGVAVWPSYACDSRVLVSWDIEALTDLIRLTWSIPRYMTATATPDTLAMLNAAHQAADIAPPIVARIRPTDRKLSHVHIVRLPFLRVDREMALGLIQHGPVLRVASTASAAADHYDSARQWADKQLRVGRYASGELSTTGAGQSSINWLESYRRAALLRGADLGRYRCIIVDGRAYNAQMHVLGLGHDGNPAAACESEERALTVQTVGRLARLDQDDPTDTGRRLVGLICGADPDTGLPDMDIGFLIEALQHRCERITTSDLVLAPERIVDQYRELIQTGEITTEDADPPTDSAKMTKRQRKLTQGDRAVAREAKKIEKRVEILLRLEALLASGKGWRDATKATNLSKYFDRDVRDQIKKELTETDT